MSGGCQLVTSLGAVSPDRNTRAVLAGPKFLTAGLALILSLCGCTAGSSDDANSTYGADFDRALDNATSGFEETVLSDRQISRDEYVEAMNRYFDCMESRGLEVTPRESGSGIMQFDVTGSWDEAVIDSAVEECSVGTTALIEPLYVNMLQNPDRRDLDDLMAECLVRTGVVVEPFTGADYRREAENGSLLTEVADDPVASMCLENPSYGSE